MFMLTGCLDNFQELNTNPESLGSVDPRSAFTGATQNFNNCSRSHLTAKYSGTMVYMQYLVSSGGPSDGYYITLLFNQWRWLRRLRIAIELSDKQCYSVAE